ncbi:hypothetical protein [Candidatus Mycoplasma haematominutum]|uniref:hypothetical protein n=1 Tax=Candidatus Mycoplasma haematominutum TaxID=209446 RepID=UPI0011B3B045|nr:hypothetical protein [Candidatus Mycoplasma haematominutum]
MSSAVATPIALSAGRALSKVNTVVGDEHNRGGALDSAEKLSVETCSSSLPPEGRIEFTPGNLTNSSKVCYTTVGIQLGLEEQNAFSTLLKSALNSQLSWANLREGNQLVYCWRKDEYDSEDEGSLWEFGRGESCEGIEYVKLGRENNGAFAARLKDSSEFKLCDRDCWTGNSVHEGYKLKQWARENSNNWKNISFYDTSRSKLHSF